MVTAVIILGAAIRLGYYVARPSFTIDETTLSLDLGMRSLSELAHPLASLQTASILFLWGEKLCGAALGINEYALRLIPLAAGLLVPWLVWRVGRRVLAEPAALLATALAAVAPALIQYSITVKPYIVDALVALVVLECTLDLLEHPDSAAGWLRFGLLGVVSVLASLPAPFVIVGATAAVVLAAPRSDRTVWRLVACVAAWSAVWAALYGQLYRPVATSWYMRQFWGPASFGPLRPAGWWNLARALIMSLIGRPAPPAVVLVFAAFVGWAFWAWLSRLPRALAALLGMPLALLLVASALGHYPLAARLLIFAVPLLVMALAALISRTAARAPRAGFVVMVLTVATLLGVDIVHPYRPPATRQAVQTILRLARHGEPVYLASGSIPAWALYTTDWSSPDTAYLAWIERYAGTPGAEAFHNSPPRVHAVGADEGADLQRNHDGRVELLALASGIQWQEGRGFDVPVVADSGWAEREAARIAGVARPTVWLLQANSYPTTVQGLAAAISGAGGAADTSFAIGGVRITRYLFGVLSAPR